MTGGGWGGEMIGKGCGGWMWLWRGCEGKWIGRGDDKGKVRGREDDMQYLSRRPVVQFTKRCLLHTLYLVQ